MTALPDPLTPAECALPGNDWFPWYPDRLRRSKWWRRASDLARARNVMLWGEAYRSAPAGSLPNDDDDLAEAAGFGMDVGSFLAVKDEIMAPWVLCSDGRWYHPTVCEVVLDAWGRLSDRRRADAERKARSRAKPAPGAKVTRDPKEVTPDKAHVTRDEGEKGRDIAHSTDSTDSTGQDTGFASLTPVLGSADDVNEFQANGKATVVAPEGPADPIREAFAAYNALAAEVGLPPAHTLSQKRRDAIKLRMKEHPAGAWAVALAEIRASPFLSGRTPKRFRADLDFLLQAKSFPRVVEGFYATIDQEETRGHAKQSASLANVDRALDVGRRMAAVIEGRPRSDP